MIIKRVKRKQARRSMAARQALAAKLVKYILTASEQDAVRLGKTEPDDYASALGHYVMDDEKLIASRAANFGTERLLETQLEQISNWLAANPNRQDLVDHWVMSWAKEDQPTVDEMFDAFDIFNQCLGWRQCPAIVGLHGNTAYRHGRQAILRVDPATGETVPRPFEGWDIDAAHRALAVIAAKYPHWTASPNRLYDVRNGRLVHRESGADVGDPQDPKTWTPLPTAGQAANTSALDQRQLAKIDVHSRQYEDDTGYKSRKRVALEEAVPILLTATSWAHAHGQLAQKGITLALAKNKGGANLAIGDVNVKASISDKTAYDRLVKRWGPFEPRHPSVPVAPYVRRAMHPGDAERAQYYAQKRAFTAQVDQLVAEVRAADREAGYRSSMRAHEVDGSKIMRGVFPSFEQWRSGSPIPDPASTLAGAREIRGLGSHQALRPSPQNFPGFDAQVTSNGVAYRRTGERYARPAIYDLGRRVYVNDDAPASVRVAVRIMAQRFPGRPLKPFGPPEFLALVEKVAAAEGVPVELPVKQVAQPKGKSTHGRLPQPLGRQPADPSESSFNTAAESSTDGSPEPPVSTSGSCRMANAMEPLTERDEGPPVAPPAEEPVKEGDGLAATYAEEQKKMAVAELNAARARQWQQF